MRYNSEDYLEFEETEVANLEFRIFLNGILRAEQEKWPVIYGQLEIKDHIWNTKNPEWHDTHVSRLMPPRPIQKDSFEQLAKDLVELRNQDNLNMGNLSDIAIRANKLLEDKK